MSRQEILSSKNEKENENAEDEFHGRERGRRRIERDSEIHGTEREEVEARQGTQRLKKTRAVLRNIDA
jgi:hypothetical protein